jgi:hypothetical protein
MSTRAAKAAQSKKGTTDAPVTSAETPAAAEKAARKARAKEINWADNQAWTFTLLLYLEEHPDFRRTLFSDSSKDANAADRRKDTGKTKKVNLHATLAEAIFAANENTDIRKEYDVDKAQYAKAVGTYLGRLVHHFLAYEQLLIGVPPTE